MRSPANTFSPPPPPLPQVSFQRTAGDGRVLGSLNTKVLPPSPRTHQLEGLQPGTSYLVCVQGLTTAQRPVSRARPHTYIDAPQHPPQPQVN